MKINIVNKSNNELPSYKTEGSAGMDLRAFINRPYIIEPNSKKIIPTGIYIELPKNYEAQIRSRSGLSANSDIFVLNSPGTIDSDYRGEIKVILYNLGKRDFEVRNGDRIAQMVISRYEIGELNDVEVLSETLRSDNGFGHTGIK